MVLPWPALSLSPHRQLYVPHMIGIFCCRAAKLIGEQKSTPSSEVNPTLRDTIYSPALTSHLCEGKHLEYNWETNCYNSITLLQS